MAASTTTQAAWTDDQLKVLETARDHPDATPSEVAEKIDDQHITSEYVVSILDGFHLPDDTDKPESEAAKRLDGNTDNGETLEVSEEDVEGLTSIRFRCAICGEVFSQAKRAKSHIAASGGAHKNRSATEEPHLVVPVGDTENILRRLNNRPEAKGVVTDDHFKILWALHRNPDASAADLADAIDMSEGTVYNRLKDLGMTGDTGDTPKDRAERVAELLEQTGIKFVNGSDSDDAESESDDSVPITPEEEYEDIFESFDSAEDVPVVDLDIGDTKDNTEVGGWYSGFVNNVEHYGAFVTLAKSGNGNRRSDLSGLVHKSNIPSMYVPTDYSEGDDVIVERLPDEDNGNLTLRMVTDPDGEFIVDGPLTPPQAAHEAAAEGEGDGTSEASDAATERVRDERGNATYDGPATGLDMTMQSIGDRPNKGTSASDEAEADDEAEAAGLDVLFPDADSEELADLRGEMQSLNEALRGKGGAYTNLLNRIERPQEQVGEDDHGQELARIRKSLDAVEATLADVEDAEFGAFDALTTRLDAIEAAVTNKDSRPEDAEFTLHLTREEMKELVREAPEDVADKALDALAEGV